MDINIFKKKNIFYNTLKNNSKNIETDDFINEWEFEQIFNDDTIKCICNHNIENVFIIKNILNNKTLNVGSDCIKKFMLNNEILKNTIDNILKAQLYIKKYSNQKLTKTLFRDDIFLDIYNTKKKYTKFILDLEIIKNPVLRKFKNYIIYSNLINNNNSI